MAPSWASKLASGRSDSLAVVTVVVTVVVNIAEESSAEVVETLVVVVVLWTSSAGRSLGGETVRAAAAAAARLCGSRRMRVLGGASMTMVDMPSSRCELREGCSSMR